MENEMVEYDMFKNYPQAETYIPDNRHSDCCFPGPFYATIVRGTTPRHSFELPFDIVKTQGYFEGDVSDLIITYKQGLDIKLTKRLSNPEDHIEILDKTDNNHSVIALVLTEDETNKFEVSTPNSLVQVQIKVKLNGEDEHGNFGVMVTPILLMNVLPDLNGEKMD